MVFRLPCTLFSKLAFAESYAIVQFKKLQAVVLEVLSFYEFYELFYEFY